MSDAQTHWDDVWEDRDPTDVSWFQQHPERSLRLITEVCPDRDGAVLDIGGGASLLVDALLDAGYRDVAVLDIAQAALDQAQHRLGDRARAVRWLVGDVTRYAFDRPVAVWHDRAVFHFLTDDRDRARYVERLTGAVAPGGHAVLATFAADGPDRCSGLPVQRYDPDELAAAVGDAFTPVSSEREVHVTPWSTEQAFTFGVFERRGNLPH